MKRLIKSLSIAAALSGLLAAPARAERIVGLTFGNSLVSFDSASPDAVSAAILINGTGNSSIIAIDRRPNGGALYGLSNDNQLFTIDETTGAAVLASTLSTAPGAQFLGFDFNPVPDRLRIAAINGNNLRVNVDTGATTVDGTLAYAATDPNAGATPFISGSAYTNNFSPSPRTTPGTTLYGIDAALDILVIQNPPNDGILNTVGSLGFDATSLLGFDISGLSGTAYVSSGIGLSTTFYTVDLGTGAATLVGGVGNGFLLLQDIAAPVGVRAVPEPGSLAMLGLGGLGLIALARRKARRAA